MYVTPLLLKKLEHKNG